MPASNENRSVISPATDDTPADTAGASRCSVLLVHGTWGRGIFPKLSNLRRNYFGGTKRWFEEGSQFYAGLDAALNVASLDWQIRAFLWSGANSVRARDHAARDLSEQLREGLKDPDATAVIIAHSHGGNVVLRALQHLDLKTGRIRVITLATPFLRVFARRSLQLSFWVKFLAWAGIFLALLISLLFLGSIVTERVGPGPVGKIALVLWIIFWMIFVLIGVASFFIITWLHQRFTNPHAALVIEELAHYDTKDAAVSRMLVIRGVDDEASLSLAAGSIGSRLSFLFLTRAIPAIYVVVLAFVLLESFGLELPSWIGWLIPGAFFGALVLFFVPGAIESFFFGREFLVNAMTCDIAVDSVPDTLGQVEAITLRPVEALSSKLTSLERPFSLRWMLETSSMEFRGIYFQFHQAVMAPYSKWWSWQLRHSIYNHPNCVDEIVRWLRRVT